MLKSFTKELILYNMKELKIYIVDNRHNIETQVYNKLVYRIDQLIKDDPIKCNENIKDSEYIFINKNDLPLTDVTFIDCGEIIMENYIMEDILKSDLGDLGDLVDLGDSYKETTKHDIKNKVNIGLCNEEGRSPQYI